MASSSFDITFRVQGREEAEAFMDALMEASDTQPDEEPQARRSKEDPVMVTEKLLRRYGQIQ